MLQQLWHIDPVSRVGARELLALRWSFVALVLGCMACTRERAPAIQTESASDAGPAVATALALVLSKPSLNLGVLGQNESGRDSVQVTNVGETALRVTATVKTPTCQAAINPERLQPGSIGALSIACQTDFLGALNEQVELTTDSQNPRKITVPIEGQVLPIVGFKPDFVEFDLAFGENQTKEVSIVGKRANDAHLAIKASGGKVMTAALELGKLDHAPKVKLTCKGVEVGMHSGSVIVATGFENPAEVALSWSCKIPGTLTVEPSNPFFNLKVSGDKAVTISVTSTTPNFKVLAAHITQGPFAARVEPVSVDGAYRINVTVLNHKIPEDARAAIGTLLIVSNDRTEPRKEVPLSGFGRINKVTRSEP